MYPISVSQICTAESAGNPTGFPALSVLALRRNSDKASGRMIREKTGGWMCKVFKNFGFCG